jgi:hypothetical protein
LERNYISLKWVPSQSSFASQNNVEVIGTFTSPPWSKRVELEFCPLRGIFVKYISNINEGTYLLKFIVNGEFRCNEMHLPVATDASGYVNNVLEIGYEDSSVDEESVSHHGEIGEGSCNESEPGILRLNKHNLKMLDRMSKKNEININ